MNTSNSKKTVRPESQSIKMVATDMDGTLVNSKKELPDNLTPMIETLRRHGIKFVVASGRQYYNLLNVFEQVRDKVVFIAENGAMIFDGDKNIFCDEIEKAHLFELYDVIKDIPNA